jgi:hypothetical protein
MAYNRAFSIVWIPAHTIAKLSTVTDYEFFCPPIIFKFTVMRLNRRKLNMDRALPSMRRAFAMPYNQQVNGEIASR